MIVVTGLMHSGVSLLARMLRGMGVPMGMTVFFPNAGPFLHGELEDIGIGVPLREALFEQPISPKAAELIARTYIRARREQYEGLVKVFKPEAVPPTWGFATPFAAPFLGPLEKAAEAEGEPVQLVITERAVGDTLKSIEQQLASYRIEARVPLFTRMADVQAKLDEALWERNDPEPTFLYEDIRRDPQAVARRLAERVGLEQLDMDRATRGLAKGD
jgi:hypothetical protein